ncbi:hypothetical protein KSS87_016570, partial [Heliosperma pusillum]
SKEDSLFTQRLTRQTIGTEGKEETFFTQGVTMQTTGHEAWKTHCSYNELQCKQWVMKQGRIIVHTRSCNANTG